MKSGIKIGNAGILIILFILSGIETFSSGKNSNDTLAIIGRKIISSENYIKSYKDKLIKLGLTDNIETRRQYLQNLISDEILIQDAYRKNLNKTESALKEYKRIYVQELLNAWSDRHISPEINITDADIRNLFIKMNTKIKARHLYASNKGTADSVYQLLLNGKEFNELAKDLFLDPVLKNNGGLLGYISVDEMDPDFEKAVYSMKIGQISSPVKTVQGYSIIKVDDIKQNPLITENEYLKVHEKLKAFARKRAYEEKTKHYVSRLGKGLNIKFNEQIVEKIYRILNSGSILNLIESGSLVAEDEIEQIIVTSSEGAWDIKTLIAEMSIVPEKQIRWIRTKENLIDFITGLINRKHISGMAKKEMLDTTQAFLQKVEYLFETYLLTIIENELKDKIKISQDSVKSYYQKNIGLFKSKPEIRLSSILLSDSSRADSIKKLIDIIPFEQLAIKYSIQTLTAEKGGDIGFFRKEDLDHLGEEVFTIKPGEWKGPFKDNDKYVFLKCTEYRESVIKPFTECSEEIEDMLRTFRWYELRDHYVQLLEKDIIVHVFPVKLNKIQLNYD